MSRAYGLVKFKSTGNIYWCCYDGTSDFMKPFLFTSDEVRDKDGYYCVISKSEEVADRLWDKDGIDEKDIDDVEIYSDYGGGYWWKGKASEKHKMIIQGVDVFEEEIEDFNEKPKWVTDFIENLD